MKRELVLSEKERAEHVMLVDLGRNDIGRVCTPGTVKVDDLMFIEKYSHVQHLVSHVEGALKPGLTNLDVLYGFDPIRVAVAYRLPGGKVVKDYPAEHPALAAVEQALEITGGFSLETSWLGGRRRGGQEPADFFARASAEHQDVE